MLLCVRKWKTSQTPVISNSSSSLIRKQTKPFIALPGSTYAAVPKSTMTVDDPSVAGDKPKGFLDLARRGNRKNVAPSSSSVHHRSSAEARSGGPSSKSIFLLARLLIPTRRRLKLDPPTKFYFPYEPGKQVRSAIKIKNISKSYVAFKFQTTAPKSCFMRPPGCVLAPGENIIATVFKFVEHPDNDDKLVEQKSKVKFKIMSLKLKELTEYVSELFDEHRDEILTEQILQVVFLDPNHNSTALEKLNRQLDDADAEAEARKKSLEDEVMNVIGEGLVIDEWKERREKYLAKRNGEVDSL